MKNIYLIILIGLLWQCSGCLSYMSLKSSQNEIHNSLKATKLGDDGIGVGVDLLSITNFMNHPIRNVIAVIGDAATIYAGYEVLQKINNDGENGSDISSGRDNNVIQINGDGNTVHVGDEQTNGVMP